LARRAVHAIEAPPGPVFAEGLLPYGIDRTRESIDRPRLCRQRSAHPADPSVVHRLRLVMRRARRRKCTDKREPETRAQENRSPRSVALQLILSSPKMGRKR
jgi:hypothetical protein